MARLAICGLLFCLTVFAVYFFNVRSSDEPIGSDIAMSPAGKPVESPVAGSPLPKTDVAENPAEASLSPEPLIPATDAADTARQKQEDQELASKATERFQSGDYEGAIKLYRELLERDAKALAGLGMSYFKLGDYENAKMFLEKASEHNPNDFDVRKLLAFVYYRKDDVEKGLEHAGAGLSLKGDPELRKLYEKLAKDKGTQDVSLNESSEHFRITFDGYKHGGVSRKVIGILEDAYGTVGKEFGYFPSEPVNAVLYTNRDFYDITQAPEWSGGIYDGKIRIPVRGAEANEAALKKVLFHEYTHSVVRSLTSRCPLWINEGLAEYFSKSYQKKVGQVIPLRSLGSSFSWLGSDKVGMAYWESYSAVSYLIERYGVYRMKEFLQSLSGGTDLEQAFRGAFGITYSEFVSSWGKG
jgi:tetratricopeptide (TPR) repeat protein